MKLAAICEVTDPLSQCLDRPCEDPLFNAAVQTAHERVCLSRACTTDLPTESCSRYWSLQAMSYDAKNTMMC